MLILMPAGPGPRFIARPAIHRQHVNTSRRLLAMHWLMCTIRRIQIQLRSTVKVMLPEARQHDVEENLVFPKGTQVIVPDYPRMIIMYNKHRESDFALPPVNELICIIMISLL